MSGKRRFEELRRRLAAHESPRVELYRKEGRSRRFEAESGGPVLALQSREEGWAVRAGGAAGSLFVAGTGEPDPEMPWPQPSGGPLRLPPARQPAAWSRPAELDAPLLSEGEASGLLAHIGSRLAAELPGAVLVRARLEEGVSTGRLWSTEGVEVSVEQRSAALLVEGCWGDEKVSGSGRRVTWYLAGRSARGFSPSAVGRRLADLLLVRGRGGSVERDRGEILLAAPAAAVLLEHLQPLFVGPGAGELAKPYRDRSGRIGGQALNVVDDGRLAGGIFEAPVDGEGVETRRLALVEAGTYRQPLVSWRQAGPGERPVGCTARPGWRDLPMTGPTHLYLEPEPSTSAGALLRGIARGFYLLDVPMSGRFDFEGDRFELPVGGFVLRRGSAAGSFSDAVLRGSIGSLLRGIQAAARDLTFQAAAGRIGAPSLLLTGLEVAGT